MKTSKKPMIPPSKHFNTYKEFVIEIKNATGMAPAASADEDDIISMFIEYEEGDDKIDKDLEIIRNLGYNADIFDVYIDITLNTRQTYSKK